MEITTDNVTGLETCVVRVSKTSNSRDLAGMLARLWNENVSSGRPIVLSCIGHHSIGQAMKAVPIMNSYLAASGVVVGILPSFETKTIQKDAENPSSPAEEISAMKFALVKISVY